jgi:hypothetical protein
LQKKKKKKKLHVIHPFQFELRLRKLVECRLSSLYSKGKEPYKIKLSYYLLIQKDQINKLLQVIIVKSV